MTSTTLANGAAHQRPVSFAGWLAASLQRLTGLARALVRPVPSEPRTAAEILALAESVQATQPSWASTPASMAKRR